MDGLTGISLMQDQWMCERLLHALRLLMLAKTYSESNQDDHLQMAVSLSELKSSGLELVDCRWLSLRGVVEHYCETTYAGDARRTFRQGEVNFNERSCFVLTEYGWKLAQYVATQQPLTDAGAQSFEKQAASEEATSTATSRAPSVPPTASLPRWDGIRQELWFGTQLIKQFRLPSPNQVTILNAFEEEGWPARIDDPLPPVHEIDPRRRLNDAIRNLNRSQIYNLLRFTGDGTGQGVLWEYDPHKARPRS